MNEEVLYNGPRFQIIKVTLPTGVVEYHVSRPTMGFTTIYDSLQEIQDSLGYYYPIRNEDMDGNELG